MDFMNSASRLDRAASSPDAKKGTPGVPFCMPPRQWWLSVFSGVAKFDRHIVNTTYKYSDTLKQEYAKRLPLILKLTIQHGIFATRSIYSGQAMPPGQTIGTQAA
ncbi:hypothetical protein [Chromobacterium sp. IIBBL 290-4]|uniref:hypothetical protein n=1 Tax=Chromobacterium sp. IIBBL 290-4 TaxID=2953890 RepID=UPI0020B764FB|nr:hypothetical protein [Chromobacterium sp. IIBBL 290-4]UTH74978.1 hypothetical protein NKT35_02410 [Chromobacterium sp. IIBBL 290-4]